MTRLNKHILVFTFLLGAMLSAVAQNSERYETKDIYLTISYVYRVHDTMVVMMNNSDNLGLETDQRVKGYKREESEESSFREIAAGRIIRKDTITAAVLFCYNPADSLEVGDMILVKVAVPELPYRSIFSKLAFNNIIFTNATRKPLYQLQDIIRRDNATVEDSIYQVVINDVHATYLIAKEKPDLPASIRQKLTSGRFKGRIPLEILRDARRSDIEAFLLYCDTYPAGYMNNDYRLSESFAAWLISNSPYSMPEVKNALFPVYKNKTAFTKLLPAYKKDILAEGTPKSLAYDALDLFYNSKPAEAEEEADFAISLAYAVNDTASKPYCHLYKAEILQEQEKYAAAIAECDKAISTAIISRNRNMEVRAIIRKGYCLFKTSDYQQSRFVIDIAAQKLAQYKPKMEREQFLENSQNLYLRRATVYYESGDYQLALLNVDTAISFNDQLNSYDAQMRNAEYYSFKGKVNNEQGKPGEAMPAFNKAITIYKNSRNISKRAIEENNLAYSYYLEGDYRKAIEWADTAMQRSLTQNDYNNAGYSKSLSGNSFWKLGQYDSAFEAHSQAIQLRMQGDNQYGVANSFVQIGDLYLSSGKKEKALESLIKARDIYKKLNDKADMADVYNKIGEVFYNDESYRRAMAMFDSAAGINSKTTIEALCKMGNAAAPIDTVKARKYYEEARQKSKATANTYYQFYSTRELAALAYQAHNLVKGDELYNECILLSRELNTDEATGLCYSLRANRFASTTELDSALVYYQKAQVIFDTLDKGQSVWQLNNIAEVYLSRGDFDKADSAYNKAISVARSTSNDLALGYTLQATSFLYGLTADFDKGLLNSDSAMAIFNRSGNKVRLANTYVSRGTLLSNMGEFRQSINAYLFADSIYQDELLSDSRGLVYNNIGTTYLYQSDYENAIKNFQLALKQSNSTVADETNLMIKGNMAECYYRTKKLAEAKKLLLDILPTARQLKLNRIASGMSLILGNVYEEEKSLSEAASYYSYAREYALKSGEKDKLIEALTSLGRIKSQENKPDSAASDLRMAANYASRYKTARGWEAYYELGLLLYNKDQFDSAIVYFRKAVEQLDKNAANLFGGEDARKLFNNDPRKSDLYNKITYSYFKTGNINESWAYANRGNLAGLKELSGSISINSSDAERNEALKKLFAMQQTKRALESSLDKQEGAAAKEEILKKIEILEKDYNNFLQDVLDKYQDLGTYFAKTGAENFSDYKNRIPGNVAVLLYLLNNNTLMIFSVTREKLAVDTMTVEISDKVLSFIAAIKNTDKQTGTGPLSVRSEPTDESNSGPVEFKDASAELYRLLIETVKDKIEGKSKLCIIPTGVFSNMPFQCLGKKLPDNGFHFLIEDKTIFYANKMSVFDLPGKTDSLKRNMASFAAFGVPDAALQYNITEAKNIGKILGVDSTIYTDARATESNAKESLLHKKYIHFATHGILNYSSDYSLSYLKFLPDKDTSGGNNGRLTMREVQGLGIQDCEMVILSACQTAVSKELVKGWNISPANSFLISHVKTVVASLWKVADEPTGLLMQYFYENLSGPKPMEKAEALRMAQVRLSQDPRFRHPNYWGAFVLYGDWR